MFQFRAFPAYHYLIHGTLTRYCRAGFPHSEISGSMRMCRSPKLIAACRVLLRLLMPRHSPCALISLTIRSKSLAILIVFLVLSLNYAGHRSLIARIVVFVTLIPQSFLKTAFSLLYPLLPCFFSSFSIVQFSRCRSPVKDRIKTLKKL